MIITIIMMMEILIISIVHLFSYDSLMINQTDRPKRSGVAWTEMCFSLYENKL